MENKSAMTHLIEKILRMPESNIKGFLKIAGPAYIEAEKDQIIRAYMSGEVVEIFELNTTLTGSEYYANNYDTTKGLPEEDSKRRAWHY